MAGQVVERLEHLRWSGGAVETDQVHVHRLERAQRRPDLGAGQHGAGQLDRDLGLDRDMAAGGPHGAPGAVDRRLGLQQVEDRLDQDEIDTPVEEASRLLLIGIPEIGVTDLAEGRELGTRSDAARHPAGPARRGEVVRRLAGEVGGGPVQLVDPVGLPVLGEDGPEGAERVGLDHVATDFEERSVDPVDDVRPGDHEELVASFEVGATEVVGGEPGQLQVGPHRTVEDDHPFGGGAQVGRRGRITVGHRPPRIPVV